VTLTQAYFDRLYKENEDPWSFRDRWYEARKRRLTLAALPDEHYQSVFEPGCSIGMLTSDLAARSDHVLAMDISPSALRQAAAQVPDNVELRQGAVPADWPPRRFGLIVVSEVGYYLDDDDCNRLADMAVSSARDLIAVHWRHPVPDYPLSGDQVHSAINLAAQRRGLVQLVSHLEADLRLDLWSADARSVAARVGLTS
jgi:trans-aconitate methyltransferase